MPKRKLARRLPAARKRARQMSYARRGYSSVPRTRGPYSFGEMKYTDVERVASDGSLVASTNWAGTEFDPSPEDTLFVPTVGSAINQRIGRKVNLHKIRIKGVINVPAQANQTAADAASIIRVQLVQDMQTNGTQMQGEELMRAPTVASAFNAVESFQSLANLGRFRVLKDKTYTLTNPNISWDGTNVEQMGLQRFFKMNVNFRRPVQVSFNATNGGTVADVVDNSFHVIINCTSIDLAPVVTYMARCYYKE